MRSPVNTIAAIYARAEEAQGADVKLRPISSFELYKGAREEELCCYRSLCRVFCMHSGGALTKQQKRILEDVREELCIPEHRADAEMSEALEDVLVSAVSASGVLKRREEFFDGVADVTLEQLSDGMGVKDDNGMMYVPPTKVSRTEHMTAASGGGGTGSWRRGAQTKGSHTALLKIIDKIGHEVTTASNKLLYAVSVVEQQAYRRTLQAKKEQLQLLLKEVEGNALDVSESSSVIPSEYGF